MALLGGFTASMGEVVHPLDTLLGAAINGGISYGIGSVYISLKNRSSRQKFTQSDSLIVGQTGTESTNFDELNGLDQFLHSQRDLRNKAQYEDLNISEELRDFLRTLGTEKGRYDGWYQDPSNLFRFRYFHEGRWTLAVSDTDSKSDKEKALSEYLKLILPVKPISAIPESGSLTAKKSDPFPAPPNTINLNTKIEQLERISALRLDKMISEIEYENLKAAILKEA